MWADFPIFGGYNKRQDISFDAEDLVNFFMVKDLDGKKKLAFLGTPGLKKQASLYTSQDSSRLLYAKDNYMYGVFGANVYRFSAPNASTLIWSKYGTIGTSTGFVSATANNANQICFVDGVSGYIFDVNAGTFTKISSGGFPAQPLNVAFLDGFFVIPLGNSNYIQISASNDGTKWSADDAIQINAYPGNNVGIGVVNRRLFCFKDISTEVLYNTGSSDFPFRPDNNLIFNYGCLTAASIASDFGYLFWLSQDKSGVGSVMMTQGDVPNRISNDSVDELISNFTDPSDLTTYIYKDMSHIFYVMNWNTDDTTLVYDVNIQQWHRMEMEPSIYDPLIAFSGKQRHLGNCHAYFNNTHYIGSYKSPTIYAMDRAYYDNDGEPIRRSRTCRHFFDESYKMMQINKMQIDMDMGIGTAGGTLYPSFSSIDPAINPKVTLQISRDNGFNFGNEREASIGLIGNNLARARFLKLGQTRDFVPKFSVYSPAGPIVVLGAAIDYEVLKK